MEETPKYRVGDWVGFCDSDGVSGFGQIVAISNDGVIKYDIKTDLKGAVYYGAREKDITYRLIDTDHNKELLKRMVNDSYYGLFPGYDREAIKQHFKEAVRKQQIRETIRKDLNNLHLESEGKNMDIRIGDRVAFRYVGEFLEGYVKKISFSIGGSVYVDIDCGGGSIITCYPACNINRNFSAERRSYPSFEKQDYNNELLKGIADDLLHAKTVLNSFYGKQKEKINYLPDKEDKKVYTPNIKINQTEIAEGDRKGIYSTVFFINSSNPVTVKKSEDADNDILLAIAYAYAIYRTDANSKFKKQVDRETIKIGNDYVVNFGHSNFFVPGEILKRKRWDIYTYVAVQLLFRTFSIKDIQEAIENCTYTKKEK